MHVSISRAGGFAAIAAPALMWSEFFTNALARPGYNLLSRPFSDLATRGTPNASEFAFGFFMVPGLLTVLLGAVLWLAPHHGRTWKAGSLLIVLAGVFLFATGVFQQDPSSVVEGLLHGTMAQTCFAIASVAPLVLFLGSRQSAGAASPRRLWLAAGVAAIGIEIAGVGLRPLMHYPDGFFQRPFTLALTVWFVATGAWLIGLRGRGLSVAD